MVEAEKIKAKVSEIYSHNNFMQECGIYIVDMSCGSATVAVKVDPKRHANLNGMAHGGLVATLADNATGIAGATIGKRVVTSTIATDFIKGAPVGTTISATSRITHADDRLVTINIEVRDLDNDTLVAKATAARIVVDTFAGIPEKW